MSAITPDLREYLISTPWVAKVATRRKNGRPWVQPVWFAVDGEHLVFVIAWPSLLGHALRRDPRLAVCVDDMQVPYSFATLEGTVEVEMDSPDAALWQERLIRRYRDDVPDPRAHAAMLAREYGGLLVRFTPHRAFFEPIVAPAPADPKMDGP